MLTRASKKSYTTKWIWLLTWRSITQSLKKRPKRIMRSIRKSNGSISIKKPKSTEIKALNTVKLCCVLRPRTQFTLSLRSTKVKRTSSHLHHLWKWVGRMARLQEPSNAPGCWALSITKATSLAPLTRGPICSTKTSMRSRRSTSCQYLVNSIFLRKVSRGARHSEMT